MNLMRKHFSLLGSKLLIAFTALSVTAITVEKSPADLVDGLAVYWSLDDSFEDEAHGLAGSASTVNDTLNLSHDNAFDTGVLVFTDTALFGQAIEMSGGENDGHLFANPSLDVIGQAGVGGFLDGNMAISVWAEATALERGWQAIAAHGEGGGYRLHRRGSDSWAAFTGNGSGDTDPAGPTTDISPGTGWHHFVARVTNDVAELWVDGQFQGSESPGTPEDRGNGVHIGMNPDTSGREWLGRIDDLGIWNRSLSDSEIFEIYTKGLSGISLLGEDVGNPFLPTPLPGPTGSNGQWGLREVTNNGTIDSIQLAVDSLVSGAGTITDGSVPTLDVTDPDTNADGGPTIGSTPHNFLSNTAADDDNITSVAKGRIKVEEGGDFTFHVNANDGFGLRIVGKEFASASNGGIIDPNDPTTLARLTPGGALGVVNLEAGEYDVEFISWEHTDQGFYEVSTAQGAITDPDLAQWIAVGDPSSVAGFSKLPTVRLAEPASAFNMPGVPEMPSELGADDGGVLGARAQFLNGNITGADDSEIVAFHDPESGNNLGGTSTPFPAQVDGTDDNDFSTAVLGQFTVDNGNEVPDELVPLTFSIQSDDNGMIRVIGTSFESSNQPLLDVDGDMACAGDFNSGNINTTCTITLEEGTHNFEAYHREQGGGAYFQIFWAEDHRPGFNAGDFTILSTDATPTEIPANTGLALVGGVVVNGDFNDDGAWDVADIDSLGKAIIDGTNDPAFDINGDGVVDIVDQDEWRAIAATENGFAAAYLPGDANLDGSVLVGDLNIVGTNWQSSPDPWGSGDFNVDGIVDVADLNLLALNWQQSIPVAAAGEAVPEPSTLALLTLAGIALVLRRR